MSTMTTLEKLRAKREQKVAGDRLQVEGSETENLPLETLKPETAPTAQAAPSFRVQDLNGIRDFTVTLDEPGVYVAKGENGAGKSSLIEALKGASGDPDANVEPTVGVDKGRVDMGGGVLFKVGNKRTKTGQPAVRLVSTSAIGQLIDPRIQDPVRANAARIRALVSLMPLPVDDAARRELTGNVEELAEWIKRDTSSDAMELGANVRLKANELALALEKRASECEGEAKSLEALVEELGELDFDAGEFDAVKRAAEEALRESAVMTQTAAARMELERQQGAIRETLGERPDSGSASEQVASLAEEIKEAEMKVAALRTRYQQAVRERARVDEEARMWDSRSQILQREVTGPTMAEAEQARMEAAAMSDWAGRAEKLERAKNWMEKIDVVKVEATAKAERAKTLRAIAQSTEAALSRLLERRGLKELAVVEGRLHWKNGERVLDYGSPMVSFGQRVRVALGVALEGIDRGSVESVTDGNRLPLLALDPDFWLALDPAKKREVHDIARERGVCLITEEPGEGELRVERVG